MIDPRILLCAALSVIAHFALAKALDRLPPRPAPVHDRKIEVRVVAPPTPPPEAPRPPDPPPAPAVTTPPKVVHERPTRRTPKPTPPAPAPTTTTAPSPTPATAPTTTATGSATQPVFGVTMESTSQAASGPAVPVGNTAQPQRGPAAAGPARPLAAGAPAAAAEVTVMPVPLGRCSGKYTDAARAAALEGTVVLDLVVDEQGRARDITVVSGLGHGLTTAAITALRDCRFTPGERAGTRVPVRVRNFKIRFVLQDA